MNAMQWYRSDRLTKLSAVEGGVVP